MSSSGLPRKRSLSPSRKFASAPPSCDWLRSRRADDGRARASPCAARISRAAVQPRRSDVTVVVGVRSWWCSSSRLEITRPVKPRDVSSPRITSRDERAESQARRRVVVVSNARPVRYVHPDDGGSSCDRRGAIWPPDAPPPRVREGDRSIARSSDGAARRRGARRARLGRDITLQYITLM